MASTRRQFLTKSLIGAGAITFAPGRKILGANDDIRLGIIGLGSNVKIGGKGRMDLRAFLKIGGVRIVALCDPDRDLLSSEAGKCAELGHKVKTYTDVRRMLDDRDIDAVSIATPNHWHALGTIWACQAGKDVYVQKPASHTLYEGRKMVEAARKYNRVVYSASLVRSASGMPDAFKWARQGNLGKVLYARGLNYRPRKSIGKVAGPQKIPSHIDYDLWCGPSPKTPLMRQNLHYDWHWDFRYGNGDLGNMGIHYLDACRMAIDQPALPERVLSIGGRVGYDDDGNTPNTMITYYDYKPAPIIFEVRALPKNKAAQATENWYGNMDRYRGVGVGIVLHCENGYIAQNKAFDNDGNLIKEFKPTYKNGKANFLDVMRSRRVSDLQGDILDGHLSASLIHTANISYKCGSLADPRQLQSAASISTEMKDAYNRFAAHLEANEIDIEKAPIKLGAPLNINTKTERFIGPMSKTANMLISKNYRKGFEVKENV